MFVRCTSVLLAVTYISCPKPIIEVEFYLVNGYSFSGAERRAIQAVADAADGEVRRFLPSLPPDLVLKVEAGTNLIPETGETAYPIPPNIVRWFVDPNHTGHSGGVRATVERELRATLFHEWHHLVRYQAVGRPQSLMDFVVSEGMATVFERDAAGASPPWGIYPKDVANWVTELRGLPSDANAGHWLTQTHDDGRRWIGMRAGAYLVDQAVGSSGRSAAELVSTPTDALLQMALVQ